MGETDWELTCYRLGLGLIWWLVALVVAGATVFIVLLFMLGCGMSPTTYEGWGCRAARVYWPDVVFAVVMVLVLALSFVLVILLRRRNKRS